MDTVRIQDHRYFSLLLGMLLLDITFIWPESYLPCRPVSCTTHRKKKSSLFRLFKNHGPEKWFSSWWLFPFISSLTRWTSSTEAWSLEADPNLRVPCAVTNSSKSYNHGFWSFQRWATGLLDTVGLDYNTRPVHPSKNVKKPKWRHTCQPVENQNNSTTTYSVSKYQCSLPETSYKSTKSSHDGTGSPQEWCLQGAW